MCFKQPQQSAAQSTTPAYVPPAQTQTSGVIAPTAVQSGVVKGDNRSGTDRNSRVRAGVNEDTAAVRKRRSAASGLGL